MIFGVDIGNSGLKAAVLGTDGSVGPPIRISWQHTSLPWQDAVSCSVEPLKSQAAGALKFSPQDPTWLAHLEQFVHQHAAGQGCQWRLSSVRSDAEALFCDWLGDRGADQLHVITAASIPMQIDVEFPGKVGVDRLLAAFAASRIESARPLVVIQAGSAVTVDLVNEVDGQAVFAGGAILPGIPMMLRLLGQGADKLPMVQANDLTELPNLPGKNTQQAMHCGAASALVGGAQHLVARYRSQFGSELPVVVSGGDGNRLLPHLAAPTQERQQLVLSGLAMLNVL